MLVDNPGKLGRHAKLVRLIDRLHADATSIFFFGPPVPWYAIFVSCIRARSKSTLKTLTKILAGAIYIQISYFATII